MPYRRLPPCPYQQQVADPRICYYNPIQHAASFYSAMGGYFLDYQTFQQLSGALQFEKQETQKLRTKLCNLQHQYDRITAVQIEELAENHEKNYEISDLKQQITKLEAEVGQLKSELMLNSKKDDTITKLNSHISKLETELKDRDSKVNALNVLNEMLVAANEKRDESISQYKKKLQETLSSSCTGDSQLENQSPIPMSESSQAPVEVPFLSLGLENSQGSESTSQYMENLQKSLNLSLSCGNDSQLENQPLIPISEPTLASNQTPVKIPPSSLSLEHSPGPWTCLPCSEDSQNIPSYPKFRQHLSDTNREQTDPTLCKKCGWRSQSDRELDLHMFEAHQIRSLFYSFSKSAILKQLPK